jgi:hypothetical protein
VDEIFFVVTGKINTVTIARRCGEKNCIALHHFTEVDDADVAKQVVDALNASNYARTISARLSA